MANPTTAFGWQMPTSTDLVTDLPADFETFGQAVDTSLADLKGGTTGQILSKASGTDMDFTWITNDVGDITAVTAGTGITGGGTSGAVTITNDMATTITTNGDLIYGTGSGTYTRRGIGSTGQVLTVSGGVPTWANAAGGGKILQVVSATYSTETDNSSATTYADSGLTATITPSSSSSKVLVMFSTLSAKNAVNSAAGTDIKILRGSTNIGEAFGVNYTGSVLYMISQFTTAIVDSPATTSATTYKLQFKLFAGAGGAQIARTQTNGSLGSVVLMEIGA